MNQENFTNASPELLQKAATLAMALKHSALTPIHHLLAAVFKMNFAILFLIHLIFLLINYKRLLNKN